MNSGPPLLKFPYHTSDQKLKTSSPITVDNSDYFNAIPYNSTYVVIIILRKALFSE